MFAQRGVLIFGEVHSLGPGGRILYSEESGSVDTTAGVCGSRAGRASLLEYGEAASKMKGRVGLWKESANQAAGMTCRSRRVRMVRCTLDNLWVELLCVLPIMLKR